MNNHATEIAHVKTMYHAEEPVRVFRTRFPKTKVSFSIDKPTKEKGQYVEVHSGTYRSESVGLACAKMGRHGGIMRSERKLAERG